MAQSKKKKENKENKENPRGYGKGVWVTVDTEEIRDELTKKDIPTPEEARKQFEVWKKYLKKVAIFQEEEAKK